MAPNKEQVYDEQIDPLMLQILGICSEHGIAMVASFHIPTPEDADLCCTSMLPDGNGKNGPGHARAVRILLHEEEPGAIAMTITSPQ